jgi:hypothetical protein
MRYIDTKRQLAGIFTKPLYSSRFANLRGVDWYLPSVWLGLRGELVFYLVYLYLLLFSYIFFIPT